MLVYLPNPKYKTFRAAQQTGRPRVVRRNTEMCSLSLVVIKSNECTALLPALNCDSEKVALNEPDASRKIYRTNTNAITTILVQQAKIDSAKPTPQKHAIEYPTIDTYSICEIFNVFVRAISFTGMVPRLITTSPLCRRPMSTRCC